MTERFGTLDPRTFSRLMLIQYGTGHAHITDAERSQAPESKPYIDMLLRSTSYKADTEDLGATVKGIRKPARFIMHSRAF